MRERNNNRTDRFIKKDPKQYKRQDRGDQPRNKELRTRIERGEKHQPRPTRYERPAYRINRTEKCPFLVRIFYAANDENTYDIKVVLRFKTIDQLPTSREVKLHLWMDSTLRQITELIRAYLPSVRTKQKFIYTKVTINPQSKQLVRTEMGKVLMHKSFDKFQQKTLYSCRYSIGDYIDVSINYK